MGESFDPVVVVENFLAEVLAARRRPFDPKRFESGRPFVDGSIDQRGDLLVAAARKQLEFDHPSQEIPWTEEHLIRFSDGGSDHSAFTHKAARLAIVSGAIEALTRRALPLSPAHMADLIRVMVRGFGLDRRAGAWDIYEFPLPGVVSCVMKSLERHGVASLGPDVLPLLKQLRDFFHEHKFYAGYKRTVANLDVLLGSPKANSGADGTSGVAIPLPEPGTPWSDLAIRELADATGEAATAWAGVMEHAGALARGNPSPTWRKEARKRLARLGPDLFKRHAIRWLDRFCTSTGGRPSDRNADLLRGLTCFAGLIEGDADVCRTLANVAETCFRKLDDGSGLLCSRAGKGCLYSLAGVKGAGLEPVAQLDRIAQRTKSPWAKEEIAAARAIATRDLGLAPADLAEMSVPTYELNESGEATRTIGDATATLRIADGGRVTVTWADAKGKSFKAAPAAARRDHADAVAALRQAAKAAEKTLAAQRDRLDALMGSNRAWPWPQFVERYVRHPLVGAIARRLIWVVDGRPVLVNASGVATDIDGKAVKTTPKSTVTVWHPVARSTDEVLAWRRRLEELRITQPFKQAHREVYLLTDAERTTRTYSNRFAAHVLRQHQLHHLAEARGWEHNYAGTWDSGDAYRVRKALPEHNLIAELWLESAGEQRSAMGVMLHVATDQVRFDPADPPEPDAGVRRGDSIPALQLDTVPPVVFSETMRDVDLFVGVASVGNDPTWQDGGPDGRYRDYWHTYAFGRLETESARTRRSVLEQLLPRLTKIRDRCGLEDRFLVVRGDLRTYKIHLGSGNVLMDPNDQYLCIVQDRAAGKAGANLFLPFEGDGTLAVILSKAFLLAADAAIEDESILRQIRR